jgi:hypothetical protein
MKITLALLIPSLFFLFPAAILKAADEKSRKK